MCGLTGFYGPGDRDDLRRMTDRLLHRGPDGEGLWQHDKEPLFLGHRRLAIVDLAGGDQPMWTAEGDLAVVYDGEIYNHAELRSELTELGHRFRTDHSDTEVLLHGYREWGQAILDRLNGMWAFALLDLPRQRLFCARDRFGQKPFFYATRPGFFAFASELPALLAHRHVSAELDPVAIRKYFAYNTVPSPGTGYRHIAQLEPGGVAVFEFGSGVARTRRWWRFAIEPDPAMLHEREDRLAERLRSLLATAVTRRLMADVPIGLFLSGGLDSSMVTAMATGAVRTLAMQAPLPSFSIGFDEPSFDETAAARAASRHLGTDHRVCTLSRNQAPQLVDEVLGKLGQWLGDSSILPTYQLSAHARESVTVALGGDGADELFAGYAPFRALQTAGWYRRYVRGRLHRAVTLCVAALPTSHRHMSFDFKLKKAMKGLAVSPRLQVPVWMSSLAPKEIDQLFGEPMPTAELFSEAIDVWDRCPSVDPIDRALEFFTHLYLSEGILAKVDRAAMMHGLEVRSPFLDIELVDWVRRLPAALKLRGRHTKYLLRKAARPILPRKVIARAQQGFAVPVGPWFRDGRLALDATRRVAGLDEAEVQRLMREHREGRADHRLFLWNLLVADRVIADVPK
ncbi:asparagine synthase (glutamine-hydrolyzing) [Sulfidibacter corallicola]|uniref:asparagine synthase (glutamine-hydrolyzing) n=1 Tax=Sulfidibacter corallicola TaxID=2818388 RepID=A0A8A4TTT6_SULCO|nr:asparagine synthase (glutamine-hydrolyzing) [Sulfidibacter corallicola]QTD52501.1 asparagine synthase (glutamine-hydrolyzing) [Sulfidibacter corallicola]